MVFIIWYIYAMGRNIPNIRTKRGKSMLVANEKELGQAIKDGQDTIEIEFDELGKKVKRIRATGKVAWGIVIVGVAGVVTCGAVAIATSVPTGGTSSVPSALLSLPAATSVIAVLGVPATISAIGIAVGGGGVVALKKLKKYRMEELPNGKVILHKK